MLGMPRASLRWLLSLLVVGLLGLSTVTVLSEGASAEGSRDSYPSAASCAGDGTGACRADIEWRTNTYGGSILRRTLFTVFAKQGETLDMGSSAVGVGSGDIVVWNPGRISDDQAPTLPAVSSGADGFTCSAQRAALGTTTAGRITTRGQELAGPQAVSGGGNPAGYVPCHYTAPSTGLYKVAFYGPTGPDASSDGAPTGDIGLSAGTNFDGSQGSSVAAWDLTVRADDTSTTDISGRVFTYALAAYTGGNGRPIDQTFYTTTDDGYVYRVDTNGLDPNGFVLYGNEEGYLDPQGNPLNHDVIGTGSQLTDPQGGVTLAPPEYPLSFSRLSADTLAALHIDDHPTAPVLSDLEFNGANTGRTAYLGKGGTFTFSQNVHGTYTIVISRDGSDFDPGKATNRVLRGVEDAGSHSVVWDGKDNAGHPFPVGTDYAVRADARAGVYHFPLIDAENSTRGGPSFTLLNPPDGVCPFGNTACTTAFYDDRGYTTSAGTVGTAGSVLPGSNPPAVDHTDAFTGYVSTTAQRAWGTATGAGGSFGDAKGLDSWTYFPSTRQTASLDVAALPAAPTADDDSGTTSGGHTLVVAAAQGLLHGDTGSGLTVTGHTAPAHGTVTVAADGGWSYTPTAGYVGTDSFGYTDTDDAGQTATAQVHVTVVSGPDAADDAGTVTAGSWLSRDAAHGLLANDTGAGVAVDSHTDPTHGAVTVGPGGAFTYTPDDGWSGVDGFDYTIVDTYGATSTGHVSLTVTPLAHDDAFTTSVNVSVDAGDAQVLLGNDDGDQLTVSGITPPSHGTLAPLAGGGYRYQPDHDFSGTDHLTYTVVDSAGQHDTATVTITVGIGAADDTADTSLDTPVTVHPLTNDAGSDLHVVSVTQPPTSQGTVTRSGDDLEVTPAEGTSGILRFDYTVQDAEGQTAQGSVAVTVAPLVADDSGTTTADHRLSVGATGGLLANDGGTSLTVVDHTAATHGTLDVDADGAYSYTPHAGFSGADSFEYTVADADGTQRTALVQLTVSPVAADDTASTSVDHPLMVTVGAGVLGNDSGYRLAVTDHSPPAHGTLDIAADGSYSYTPAPGWSGADSFDYVATDHDGGTATATAHLRVTPRATGDAARTGLGTPVTLHLLGNDAGSGLTVTDHTSPGNGSLSVQPDGTAVYTPATGWSGVASFGYTAEDTDGQQTTATAAVTVGLAAAPDEATTQLDTPVTLHPLANDGGQGLHVVALHQPATGTGSATVSGDDVVVTPAGGRSGTVRLSYDVADADGQTVTAVPVTVHVLPAARDDVAETEVGHPLSVAAADGLLANDGGTERTVTDHTSSGHGTVTVRPNGSFDYSPAAGFSGRDYFDYRLQDAEGQTATATVTLTVSPRALDDHATTTANRTVVLSPLGNDAGSAMHVGAVAQPRGGTATVTAAGDSVRVTPAHDLSGVVRFVYTARDADGLSATAVDSVTVLPDADPERTVTPVGTPVTLDAPANDHGTRLRIVTVDQPPAAQGVVDIENNRLTLLPAHGFTGTVHFAYTVADVAQHRATATDTVVVEADPQAAPDHGATAARTPVVLHPLDNDPGSKHFDTTTVWLRDPQTGQLTRRLLLPGQGLFAVDPATGTVLFVPDPGFTGTTEPVTYQVLDRTGRLHVSTMRVDVGVAASGGHTTGTTTGHGTGLQPGSTTVAAQGLQPGAVVNGGSGELGDTGAPMSPVLPVGGLLLVVAGAALLRRSSLRPALRPALQPALRSALRPALRPAGRRVPRHRAG